MFSIQSHSRPSLSILNALREYDDFMESIKTLVDLGCGSGDDLIWWATAATREDVPKPLNIKCTGVDKLDRLSLTQKYSNIIYQCNDFEKKINPPKELFDVLWCHDAFQYCINPIETLVNWRQIASDGAMLMIAVPQTIQIHRRQLNYFLPSGVYYHHTMISLIYMLSASGWDCNTGFFQQLPNDPWIRAVVYKSNNEPLDPKTTTWYELAETKLLPDSASKSILAYGYPRHQDLILPWIDKSFADLGQL